jgi:hypothetical protein
MNKIDSKLEKILYPYIDTDNIQKLRSSIKHLILSEIKKVEPKKANRILITKEDFEGPIHLEIKLRRNDKIEAFNQAISEYHKALEELLK